MDSPETMFAIMIAFISALLGLLIFIFFFDPWSGSVRPRYRGLARRFFKWLWRNKVRIAVFLLVAAGILAVIFIAIRFGGTAIQRISALLSSNEQAAPQVAVVAAEKKAVAESETLTAENSIIIQANEEKLPPANTLAADHTIANLLQVDRIPQDVVDRTSSKFHIAFVQASPDPLLAGAIQRLIQSGDFLLKGIDFSAIIVEVARLDFSYWEEQAKAFLLEPSNEKLNIIMWSWGSQFAQATEADIELYIETMASLENSFPDRFFIYMTGTTQESMSPGSKIDPRNERIRNYCQDANKPFFDLADLEHHGVHETTQAHLAWWLWARLAGWDGTPTD